MAKLQHPATLNPLQQFRQASWILNHTTRASNPAWFQYALELNFQLHIRPNGPDISTFYFDRLKDEWSAGPTLTEEIFNDSSNLNEFITGLLRTTREKKANSIGVILHIADDFSTTELKPELDNPAALPDLRDTAVFDPASILEDSSIQANQGSWRVIPYPAVGSEVIGTTITLTREYAPFFAALHETSERENFPIITHCLSAPLVAIMGLSDTLSPTPEKPFVAILEYPWFTTLAFFNEHSDLRLIRTLPHRGISRATNLRNALTTTNASLEFEDPDLFLIPLTQTVDSEIETSLRVTHTASRVETLRLPSPNGTPDWCPEPSIAVKNATKQKSENPTSHTFTILRDEKWATQNFLPIPKELAEIYPNRSEMRLIKIFRLTLVVIFAITILGMAYFAFGIIDIVRRPEWAFDIREAANMESRIAMFNSDREKFDHWDNLLQGRSKAWTAMESLSRMFPENGTMLVKTYAHTSRPQSAAGLSKVGFIKEWKINGFARDEALEYLNTLNTREGINAHFSEIAHLTANTAYDPDTGNRNISNIRTQENSGFKFLPAEEVNNSEDSSYRFSFDMTIIQRFEATDPLAITVPKVE